MVASSRYVKRSFSFPAWLLTLCVFASVASAFAQSSAHPSPVEVLTPKPPTAVMIEGKSILVYELHITNFGPSALTLTEIQVFASGPGTLAATTGDSNKIADYSGSALTPLLHPVDASSQMSDASHMGSERQPEKLDVGSRVVAFMYVTVPEGLQVSALRHRLLFDVADPARAKGTPNDESALDGVMVPVLQTAPLLLAPPFKGGVWLAGNGPSNTSDHRRTLVAIDGKVYISQRFAIDWVMAGPNGNTFHDSRERNENFWGFGQPVLAVADGEVTELVDDFPDNIPGKLPLATIQNLAGNHVIMHIAPGVYTMFAHLKQGSVRVHLNQKVKRGTPIAEVGNSGNTTGAHMHFQVTDGNSALAAEGIPFIFEKFRFLGFGKDFEEDRHPDLPRSRTLPADDSVIAF